MQPLPCHFGDLVGTGRALCALYVSLTLGCSFGSSPRLRQAGPPPLGLNGPETYHAFLAAAPPHFKMHHQVAATFGDRDEVITGWLVMERPARFRVRAMAPLGVPLFDVQSEVGEPTVVQVFIDALRGDRLPHYLARDLHRIYTAVCPATTEVVSNGELFVVRCTMAPYGEEIADGEGPDDTVELHLSRSGLLRHKLFFRGPRATVRVSYDDYRQVSGRWLAHHIQLAHKTLPYALRVALVSADLDYDTTRAFGETPE